MSRRKTDRVDIPLRLLSREREALLRMVVLGTERVPDGLPSRAMEELKRALLGTSYDNSGLYVTEEEGRWLADFLETRIHAAQAREGFSENVKQLVSGTKYVLMKLHGAFTTK